MIEEKQDSEEYNNSNENFPEPSRINYEKNADSESEPERLDERFEAELLEFVDRLKRLVKKNILFRKVLRDKLEAFRLKLEEDIKELRNITLDRINYYIEALIEYYKVLPIDPDEIWDELHVDLP